MLLCKTSVVENFGEMSACLIQFGLVTCVSAVCVIWCRNIACKTPCWLLCLPDPLLNKCWTHLSSAYWDWLEGGFTGPCPRTNATWRHLLKGGSVVFCTPSIGRVTHVAAWLTAWKLHVSCAFPLQAEEAMDTDCTDAKSMQSTDAPSNVSTTN